MPGFDRTGPRGQGPLTGRGLGYCEGNEAIPARGYGLGLGRGFGRGAGRGLRRGLGAQGYGRLAFRRSAIQPYDPIYSKEDEINLLKQELKELKNEKKYLAEKIEALEKSE